MHPMSFVCVSHVLGAIQGSLSLKKNNTYRKTMFVMLCTGQFIRIRSLFQLLPKLQNSKFNINLHVSLRNGPKSLSSDNSEDHGAVSFPWSLILGVNSCELTRHSPLLLPVMS